MPRHCPWRRTARCAKSGKSADYAREREPNPRRRLRRTCRKLFDGARQQADARQNRSNCEKRRFPELEDEAFALKAGRNVSDHQVDASTFVILYCQERIPARDVTLDGVRDQIVSQIRKMREVTAAGEFYANTIKRATIVDNLTQQSISPATASARESRAARVAAPEPSTTRR